MVMLRLPLSQTGPADKFAQAVEAYRQAKLAHRFTVDVPAPTADPLVESVVRRVQGEPGKPDDFIVLNYEIEDDLPKPPPTPEQQQALDVLRETIG